MTKSLGSIIISLFNSKILAIMKDNVNEKELLK